MQEEKEKDQVDEQHRPADGIAKVLRKNNLLVQHLEQAERAKELLNKEIRVISR